MESNSPEYVKALYIKDKKALVIFYIYLLCFFTNNFLVITSFKKGAELQWAIKMRVPQWH